MDKMKISQKIAELRIKRGLTAKGVGGKIGKSETTILNYEAGKIDIPLSSLLGIAEVLEVEPAVLVGGEEDEFGAEITIRAYREEDRRTLISILGMNGYTTRQIKVARPRFSRKTGTAITPKDTVNYETLVHMEYLEQCNGFRFEDDAMLDLRIKAYYSIPKSASKKKKAAMLAGEIRPTKKPDMDNVVKIIADSLNQVAYRDDTQIVDQQCRKFYSENPRVEVTIINLSKDENEYGKAGK